MIEAVVGKMLDTKRHVGKHRTNLHALMFTSAIGVYADMVVSAIRII